MIPIFIETETDADLSKRAAGRVVQAVLHGVATHWSEELFPRRFVRGAGARFGYQRRRSGYEKRKRAFALAGIDPQGRRVQKGGGVPALYTGLLERLANRFHPIRATSRQAVVVVEVPSYVSRRRDRRRPDIVKEISRITAAEDKELEQVGDEILEVETLAQQKRTKTRTRR